MPDRQVPVIAFASTKGGVGKTTLAFVIATAIARWLPPVTEYRVACIDCDPNGRWTQPSGKPQARTYGPCPPMPRRCCRRYATPSGARRWS